MRLAGFVSRMGKVEVHREFLKGYLKVGRYLVDIIVDGRIMLKYSLKKLTWLGVVRIDLFRNRDRSSELL